MERYFVRVARISIDHECEQVIHQRGLHETHEVAFSKLTHEVGIAIECHDLEAQSLRCVAWNQIIGDLMQGI